MTAVYSDRLLLPDGVRAGSVNFENGTIFSITETPPSGAETADLSGKLVSPGFIDLHTHGGGGFPFIEGTAEDMLRGCFFHMTHGTTTLLPTVSAAPFETMKRAVLALKEAKESGKLAPNVPGVHLEGPYLSAKQCGAQCPTFITPPDPSDYEPLVKEYGDMIARWTFAPENDRDGVFCAFLSAHGILPSAGHTDAVYRDMDCAIANGCRLVTHLYSCNSTVTRDHGFRSLGVIETALLRDELDVEIIADGRHLPPELIRLIVKVKGVDHTALVTDSLPIAGTDIKEGVLSGTPFIVEDGVCKLRDRSAFAGSVAAADDLIRVMTECGYPLTDAVKMMTEVPARILHLNKGVLREGADADLIAFDDDIRVTDVFVGGRRTFRN